MTGVSFYDIPVTGKRLALLHELVPNAEVIAVLQDPNSGVFQTETREIETTVRAMGQKIITLKAASEQEINAAFSTLEKSGAGALFVGAGAFFNARRNQLIGLAALHAIPASYVFSGSVAAGGLVSYGASQTDAYRRAGVYVAGFSAARSRAIFRLNFRRSSISLSTSGPPRHSASQCLLRSSLAPTR